MDRNAYSKITSHIYVLYIWNIHKHKHPYPCYFFRYSAGYILAFFIRFTKHIYVSSPKRTSLERQIPFLFHNKCVIFTRVVSKLHVVSKFPSVNSLKQVNSPSQAKSHHAESLQCQMSGATYHSPAHRWFFFHTEVQQCWLRERLAQQHSKHVKPMLHRRRLAVFN